jgi:hypothetical protein
MGLDQLSSWPSSIRELRIAVNADLRRIFPKCNLQNSENAGLPDSDASIRTVARASQTAGF